MFARKLIEREAWLRVGDGKSIRIFHDSWLLNSLDGKVVSPQNSLAPDSTVDTLIDAQTSWWNTHLIDLCFYPPEAALIKSLPLCIVPQPDILIWPKENSGMYFVKSGYKCLMEIATFDTIRPIVSVAQKYFWKKHLETECTGENQALLMEIMHKLSALKRKSEEKSHSY